MTTRFPPANLPENMVPFQKALENTLISAENAQDNTASITQGMNQSAASNFGLGSRLPALPASLANKVYTNLQSTQSSPGSALTLQMAWTNIGNAITITTPNFASNVALAVASATVLDITGGNVGGTYSHWLRVNVSGGITEQKMVPVQNFGQTLFTANNIPANTNISVRLQVWGIIQNTNGTFVTGTIGTSSISRITTTLRAIALV